jgi:hypothetical protein
MQANATDVLTRPLSPVRYGTAIATFIAIICGGLLNMAATARRRGPGPLYKQVIKSTSPNASTSTKKRDPDVAHAVFPPDDYHPGARSLRSYREMFDVFSCRFPALAQAFIG